jgi:hypothetical protein
MGYAKGAMGYRYKVRKGCGMKILVMRLVRAQRVRAVRCGVSVERGDKSRERGASFDQRAARCG